MFFSEVRLADEKHQLEDQLRSFDEQYQQISIGAAEFRRFRHDMLPSSEHDREPQ